MRRWRTTAPQDRIWIFTPAWWNDKPAVHIAGGFIVDLKKSLSYQTCSDDSKFLTRETDMEKIIIGLIIGLSILYLVRRIWRTMTVPPEDVCAGGCAGCGAASTCDGSKTVRQSGNAEGGHRDEGAGDP